MKTKEKRSGTSLKNLIRAVKSLREAVQEPIRTDRDVAGVIKCFEVAYELSWKTLKKILEEQGVESAGPRDVFSKAFRLSLIDQEGAWLAIMDYRNLSVHVYDQKFARTLCEKIKADCLPAFEALAARIK